MARSLNKAQLIGNLTRDPELRYTPQGTAVCTFGLATNRTWTTDNGEKREDAEFHKIVAWNKLAELCSQLLVKGRKVFVEGRIATRSWTGQDGAARNTTEIVIEDMIILDSKRTGTESADDESAPAHVEDAAQEEVTAEKKPEEKPAKNPSSQKATKGQEKEMPSEDVNPDDIPF